MFSSCLIHVSKMKQHQDDKWSNRWPCPKDNSATVSCWNHYFSLLHYVSYHTLKEQILNILDVSETHYPGFLSNLWINVLTNNHLYNVHVVILTQQRGTAWRENITDRFMQRMAKCHLIENMTKTIHINSLQGLYLLMLDKIWPVVWWQTQDTILNVQKLHLAIFQHNITSMKVACKT